MQQNAFTFLNQAIGQLLTTKSAMLQATGLDIFRGLAVILIVWFGIKSALAATQGFGGFHFARFADLILMIAFGLGMLTYYSTPIPGMGYSFCDLITITFRPGPKARLASGGSGGPITITIDVSRC